MHLAPNLKQYVVFRTSPGSQPTHPQAPPFDVKLVITNLHMALILVHVGKNLMEDVLLDGRLGVNIIMEDLKKKLRLIIPKLAPYTLKMSNQTLTKPVGLIRIRLTFE
jgi:hypothetical protein